MCCDFRNRDLCLLNPFKGNEASIRSNLASQSVAGRSADLIEKKIKFSNDFNHSPGIHSTHVSHLLRYFYFSVSHCCSLTHRSSRNIESIEEQVRLLSWII